MVMMSPRHQKAYFIFTIENGVSSCKKRIVGNENETSIIKPIFRANTARWHGSGVALINQTHVCRAGVEP